MSMVAFLLDENVDHGLYEALKQRCAELVVYWVGGPDAPTRGTGDAEILMWCEVNRISLVTNNRHSMPGHLRDHLAFGRTVPGIFLLPRGVSLGDLAERLALVWGASESEEYLDQLVHLKDLS